MKLQDHVRRRNTGKGYKKLSKALNLLTNSEIQYKWKNMTTQKLLTSGLPTKLSKKANWKRIVLDANYDTEGVTELHGWNRRTCRSLWKSGQEEAASEKDQPLGTLGLKADQTQPSTQVTLFLQWSTEMEVSCSRVAIQQEEQEILLPSQDTLTEPNTSKILRTTCSGQSDVCV